MTINTGISTSLLRPNTFHAFTYQYAHRSLISLPMRVALVGAKSSTGTATSGTVYQLTDEVTWTGLFGASSELTIMANKAAECASFFQKGPMVFAVPLTEPGAGVANVQTITVTGTATAQGNAPLRVAGRPFSVGIASGDVQNTVATSIANALKFKAETLPVVVTVATNVVTLTHATKGVNGVDVKIDIDGSVPGVTLTVATGTAGTGVLDHQVALDALSSLDYDAVIFSNHASADITEIVADKLARWNPATKRWRWYVLGEMGTIGTATTLAAAANSEAVIIGSCEGCRNTAGEIATAVGMLAFSRERPNAGYSGAMVPLFPPAAATVYTPDEVETALLAGLTPLTARVDSAGNIVANQVKCERMITTKTTTGASNQPFAVLRDLAVSRTGVYMARQLDAGYEARFGAESNTSTGTLDTDETKRRIATMAKGIARDMGDANPPILTDVEDDLTSLVVEDDPIASARVNVEQTYTVVLPLEQVAWKHNIQI